ncbi:2-dehydro-3-deoxy-phosphogluconate aldolase [Gracilibacillus lacisalsi]|uniref:2-dehydro-3-deoxy-phosphogluconate aldolase n=1 Tax=Gracilibacillus lacisalsi TaxID=393087 RepID=UPI00036C121D|nr:KDGP aldolase [Gracilibacillus lacisalsi]
MASIFNHFYQNRVALNVLANSIDNAKDIYQAAEKHVLVGVLSKDYRTTDEAIQAMKAYGATTEDAVSIGLGAGDSRQAPVVAEIAKQYTGKHINQVFPYVGHTKANTDKQDCWINSLVTPSGKIGYVNISTGPISEHAEKAMVPVKSAISLVRDMGGKALKYFPMQGLATIDEYKAVAKACGEENFALEPTGGIDKTNFTEILDIALSANVPQIIPHVYSSIIDKETGKTNVDDVTFLLQQVKKLVDQYV